MQKKSLNFHLQFQRRWLLYMLALSLAVHGFVLLLPGLSPLPQNHPQENIVVGFEPRIVTLPAVITTPQPQPGQVNRPPDPAKDVSTKSQAPPTQQVSTEAPPPPVAEDGGSQAEPAPQPVKQISRVLQPSLPTTIPPAQTRVLLSETDSKEPAPAASGESDNQQTKTAVTNNQQNTSAAAIVEAPPAYLDNPRPTYPPLARQRGWQGDVLVRVSVDPRGEVVKVTLLQSSGHKVLDRSALKQVRRWRFKPARRGDTNVAGEVTVPVHFRLRQS